MKRAGAKIPVSVLAQALGIAVVVGIPFLFVAINQFRRACGSDLFGSREHFCSAHELWRWLLSLPGWDQLTIVVAAVGCVTLARSQLRRLAS
jgi:hypothetical protein